MKYRYITIPYISNSCDAFSERRSGKAFDLVENRELAVAEALVFCYVKRESLGSNQPRYAWTRYTTARNDLSAVVAAAAAADEREVCGARGCRGGEVSSAGWKITARG